MDFWKFVSNVANISGIISIPIAFYELFSIKSKMKKAQESMDELLKLKDYQTLSELLNKVSKMQDVLSKLQINAKQRGINVEDVQNQCQGLVDDFNKCIVEVPCDHEDLTDLFIKGKESIQKYIENNTADDLRETQRYLHSIIKSQKKLTNHILKDEAERIAKSE